MFQILHWKVIAIWLIIPRGNLWKRGANGTKLGEVEADGDHYNFADFPKTRYNLNTDQLSSLAHIKEYLNRCDTGLKSIQIKN